jgi:hypothetical protein
MCEIALKLIDIAIDDPRGSFIAGAQQLETRPIKPGFFSTYEEFSFSRAARLSRQSISHRCASMEMQHHASSISRPLVRPKKVKKEVRRAATKVIN